VTERRADAIAARFRTAAPTFAAAFHADAYEIVRTERVPDGSGGWTVTERAVETGWCSLDVARFRGSERPAGGDVVTSIAAYTVELPIDSTLTAADTLVINGRPFNVLDVKRGGEMALFTEATVEERS
jgi:hypothetical protein